MTAPRADLLAALEGLLTVDWNLEHGDFYDPTTYAGKVWANVRAAIAAHKEGHRDRDDDACPCYSEGWQAGYEAERKH